MSLIVFNTVKLDSAKPLGLWASGSAVAPEKQGGGQNLLPQRGPIESQRKNSYWEVKEGRIFCLCFVSWLRKKKKLKLVIGLKMPQEFTVPLQVLKVYAVGLPLERAVCHSLGLALGLVVNGWDCSGCCARW